MIAIVKDVCALLTVAIVTKWLLWNCYALILQNFCL